MHQNEASQTAVLACQGRAVAHDRLAVVRFEHPTAMALLRQDERAPVNAPGPAWRAGLEGTDSSSRC